MEKITKKNNTSISKWAKNNTKNPFNGEYQESYFILFGLVKDDALSRPEKVSFENDIKRKKI
ncbi:MAG: hypothetical protein FWF38_01905 [Spirochaetaceae bacterium]|nr:hypothetical protein [Spirochaetaceae bacterium]